MYVSSVPQPRHSYGSVAAYPAGLNYGASGYYGAPLVGGQGLVQSTNLIQGGVAPQYVSAGGFARQGGALVRNSYERLPAHANVIDAGVNVRERIIFFFKTKLTKINLYFLSRFFSLFLKKDSKEALISKP